MVTVVAMAVQTTAAVLPQRAAQAVRPARPVSE